MLDLMNKLDEDVLIGDGAIGTLLADRDIASPYNGANLTHPQVVQDPHEEYLRAGAGIIETNTFSAISPET